MAIPRFCAAVIRVHGEGDSRKLHDLIHSAYAPPGSRKTRHQLPRTQALDSRRAHPHRQDARGHHRIPIDALEEFLPAAAKPSSPRISGRNQLLGTVVEVTIDGLLAKVVLAVGGQRVTAIITADAARELALKPATRPSPSSKPPK